MWEAYFFYSLFPQTILSHFTPFYVNYRILILK
uniref:Uncharacterized protein n=2 Tax=unclassified Caudoviricetes TaxID=2788787 RepID=A0A8S5QJD5_9CAUD|nr:MAG TPA: hypothetical protein [Siphoviridae sp. ctVii20]DAE19398.1 MAG TPA: hypothetical protein [Siphoviridae sp. ctezl47]